MKTRYERGRHGIYDPCPYTDTTDRRAQSAELCAALEQPAIDPFGVRTGDLLLETVR